MKPTALLLGAAAAVAISIAVVPTPAHAQPGSAEPVGSADRAVSLIEERLPELLSEHDVPGAAASLVVDGETVHTEGYGTAVVEDDIAFGPDTPYYAASLTKLFTTATALQLVADGDLDLDADVNDQLDGVEVPDTYPGEPLTLRHLLTHSSGFEYRIWGWSRWDRDDMPSLAEFVDEQMPERVRPPGTDITYNNFDMVLAGLLIEQAAGESYADVVQSRVFDPVGMDHSAVLYDEPDPEGTASGYRSADVQVPTTGLRSPAAPSGPGVIISAEDMTRFMSAVIERDPALDGVAEQMTSRQFGVDDRMPGIGFSFHEFASAGSGVWFKSGDISGFHNATVIAPEAGVGFHVAFNGDGLNGAAVEHAAFALAGEVLDALGVTASPSDPESVDDDVDDYTGEYLSTRTTRSDFTEVTRIFDPVTVDADGGELVTSGIGLDPEAGERRWVPAGDGLFRERDGVDTILFTDDGTLITSEDATVAYEPLPAHESGMLHLVAMGIGALALLIGFIVLTAAGVARPFRGIQRGPGLRIATAWSAWLLCAAAVGVLGLMAVATADGNLMVERVVTGSTLLEVAVNMSLSTVAMTALTAVLYVVTALARKWTVGGAIRYGLLVAGAAVFSVTLLSLNLAAL